MEKDKKIIYIAGIGFAILMVFGLIFYAFDKSNKLIESYYNDDEIRLADNDDCPMTSTVTYVSSCSETSDTSCQQVDAAIDACKNNNLDPCYKKTVWKRDCSATASNSGTCSPDGSLPHCTACKYYAAQKFCTSCENGYKVANGVCVKQEGGYDAGCNVRGCTTCSSSNSQVCNVCDTANGYIKSGNSCVCDAANGYEDSNGSCVKRQTASPSPNQSPKSTVMPSPSSTLQPTASPTGNQIQKVCCDRGNSLGAAFRYTEITEDSCRNNNWKIEPDVTKCGMEEDKTEHCFYKTNYLGSQIYCYGTLAVCSGFSQSDIIDRSKDSCNASSAPTVTPIPSNSSSPLSSNSNTVCCDRGNSLGAAFRYTEITEDSCRNNGWSVVRDVTKCGTEEDKTEHCFYRTNSFGAQIYCYGTLAVCSGFSQSDIVDKSKDSCNARSSQLYIYSPNTSYSSTIPDNCVYSADGTLVTPNADGSSPNLLCQYTISTDTSKCNGSDTCYEVVEYVKEEKSSKKSLMMIIYTILVVVIVASVSISVYSALRRNKRNQEFNK